MEIETRVLPNESKELYERFPELEQYKGREGLTAELYLDNCEGVEEAFELFIEDGKEINFDGLVMGADISRDGKERIITSFEDYVN